MFRYETTIHLQQTDAGGVLYFAQQMSLCHEAYEAALTTAGVSIARIMREGEYLLPLVHAEIDLLKPVFVGDVLTVLVSTERIATSSFVVGYTLTRDDAVVGKGQTVHVAIGAQNRAKRDLPNDVLKAVQAWLPDEH